MSADPVATRAAFGAYAWDAALRGAVACLQRDALGAYVLWLALGSGLGIAAQTLGGLLDTGGSLPSLAVLLLTQSLTLARTAVRGRWLAAALDRVR